MSEPELRASIHRAGKFGNGESFMAGRRRILSEDEERPRVAEL